ncbi:PREDICTED: uncharacterized protein LOC106104452 [Papilio polytes]|uniref:uncharacterized protein LOC106104452 n=1 Tax=Papilio polytes TaxID=76194 RepID=UPI00067648AF|nr:PREDICTED: uncharacterized protein LOC106104452 [Papilio polytes]
MLQLTLADVSKQLTKDVIVEAFRSKTNSKIDVENVQVTTAAPKGEGLISAVYRINVSGSHRSASFVAKGLVHDAVLRRTLNCSMYFRRETLFFSKILPILIELQESLGANEKIQNSVPNCYDYFVDGQNDYILMEDLAARGYASIPPMPTEFERNEALKVLSHLHAVSMALRITKPFLFTKITNEIFEIYYREDKRSWYTPYLLRAMKLDLQVLSEDETVSNTIYYDKFKKLASEDPYGELVRLVTTRGEYAVINHGDAWCPNFLCSKENAIAIDFQLIRATSPATDLSYFILLCGSLCQSKNDFMKAVDIYYSNFEYYLRDMNIKPEEVFTKQMLYSELKKYGKFGLLAASTSIPLLASERCDVNTFESKYAGVERIPLEELWKLTPITDKNVKESLINAVRVATDLGFI